MTKPTTKKCGAKNRAGKPCTQPAMENGRCRYHGGLSLKGAASPQFKTGRFSKYMPTRLLEKFKEAATNPNLRSMDEDLALLETRICETLEKLNQPGAVAQWSVAVKQFADLRAAMASGNVQLTQAALKTLGDTLERGAATEATWREIRDTIQDRRRILDSMAKQEYASKAMMPLSEAMTLFTAMVGIIKERISDRDTLNAILGDVNRLSTRADGPALEAGGAEPERKPN